GKKREPKREADAPNDAVFASIRDAIRRPNWRRLNRAFENLLAAMLASALMGISTPQSDPQNQCSVQQVNGEAHIVMFCGGRVDSRWTLFNEDYDMGSGRQMGFNKVDVV